MSKQGVQVRFPGTLKLVFAIGFLLILSNGCGIYKSKNGPTYVKTCNLPANQASSLQGHWKTPPIKFSFYSVNGQFSGGDVSAVQAGAKTWNNFFTVTKGGNIFDPGPSGVGNQSTLAQETPNCNSATVSDGTVLYKRYANWTKSPVAVAVTTYCFRPVTASQPTNGVQNTNTVLPTNEVYNAIMEFNYQNFFTQGTGHYPDLQSIALHELGHLLGLDHSCGPLGLSRAGQTNVTCPDPNADPSNSLFDTVMFPQIFFDPSSGNGEVKQQLSDNDEGRANCVY